MFASCHGISCMRHISQCSPLLQLGIRCVLIPSWVGNLHVSRRRLCFYALDALDDFAIKGLIVHLHLTMRLLDHSRVTGARLSVSDAEVRYRRILRELAANRPELRAAWRRLTPVGRH